VLLVSCFFCLSLCVFDFPGRRLRLRVHFSPPKTPSHTTSLVARASPFRSVYISLSTFSRFFLELAVQRKSFHRRSPALSGCFFFFFFFVLAMRRCSLDAWYILKRLRPRRFPSLISTFFSLVTGHVTREGIFSSRSPPLHVDFPAARRFRDFWAFPDFYV